jgi:ferric-dicitrate binding protein FerR (iron transport regulator)
MDYARLARYLAGECARAEADEIERWIEADPAHRQLVMELGAIWEAAATPPVQWDTAAAWRRLAARLRSREGRSSLTLVRDAPPTGGGGRLPAWRPALAAAAVLTLAGGLWWNGASTGSVPGRAAEAPLREVRVPLGQRAQFQLTDGTRVLLGPGSVLRYDTTRFGGSTRELQLSGQAHFTVTHDPHRPFMVRTARTVTEDLGTEFAITDYPGDSAGVVVVASGTVAVRGVTADTARPATVLRGGDLLLLDPHGRSAVERGVSLGASLAWTEGRLVFEDTPVGDVVTRLNRWYGGDVRLGHPALARLRFTAAYDAASEATVVRELATAIGARVRHRGSSTILVPRLSHPREK